MVYRFSLEGEYVLHISNNDSKHIKVKEIKEKEDINQINTEVVGIGAGGDAQTILKGPSQLAENSVNEEELIMVVVSKTYTPLSILCTVCI